MRSILLISLLCSPIAIRAQTSRRGQWLAFNRAGAPNSNLQCFAAKNIGIVNGYLIISTKRETATCSSFDLPLAQYNYTSGFVAMRSFHFLYGTVEVRAKFGGGMRTGAWPAVWMADASCQASDPTGTDDHCNGQEIDVAEILNSDFRHVNQQIHVNNFTHNDGCRPATSDMSQTFHIYKLVWAPGSIIFEIDGKTTCTITKWYVPRSPMYLKISVYVGRYGGPVRRHSLPWTTLIDYVRVSQNHVVVFDDNFDNNITLTTRGTSP